MRSRRWTLVVCCALLPVVPTACQSDDVRSVRAVEGDAPDETVDTTDTAARDYYVESLGVSFDLADSFEEYEPDGLAFGARSLRPQALITIAPESTAIVQHDAELGETVVALTISGHDAQEITNASIDGLPDGISANELFVENGDRSFSVIMSAESAALDELWNEFFTSVTVLDDD